ncbi:hypothetical protein [Microvirga calopogonii]|uniref:hypothetical protein n=1 Tax=Microvirga calopogonii TaxID=2078013 RepID=UPI000E0D7CBE|nr:hypothetical protein [Microvirga calopogonii]
MDGISLVGVRGREMGLDDPFPIEKCSGRVRGAILAEFKGRCPTIREVASISDAQWLTVPNIGPTTLEELRSMTHSAPNGEERPNTTGMPDGELLSRLNRLQRELNIIVGEIRARLSGGGSKNNQSR